MLPQLRETLSVISVIQQDLESRHLPPIEPLRFNGNPSKWPEFIQSFKERVHEKRTFTDNVRMERLLSVLDGEAKRVVTAIGRNGMFYATALKTLKREFGNSYAVSHLKLKEVLNLPQISEDDSKGLRHFHQQIKGVVTWLNSMGYSASLKATESVTKAVMRLPKNLRSSFYKHFNNENFDENKINLITFEKRLANKVQYTFKPYSYCHRAFL